jgi:hypothetical protein
VANTGGLSPEEKKADVEKHPEVFLHVGLLVDEPPSPAGLPFIQSSDNIYFDSHRRRPAMPIGTEFASHYAARCGVRKEILLILGYEGLSMARGWTIRARPPSAESRVRAIRGKEYVGGPARTLGEIEAAVFDEIDAIDHFEKQCTGRGLGDTDGHLIR